MESTKIPIAIDADLLERISSIALAIGVLGVFQHNFESFYMVSRPLLVLAVASYLFSQGLKHAPLLKILERGIVLGMIMGILGMFQPWNPLYFEYGFYLVGISTLSFIIITHIPSVAAQE